MSANLNSALHSVDKVPYVGKKFAEDFCKLSIETVEDLLLYKPKDVLDLSSPMSILQALAVNGKKVIISGEITKISQSRSPKKRMWVTTVEITDESGTIEARWFNQPFLKNSLKVGRQAIFYGPVEFDFYKKTKFLSSGQIFDKTGLFPIYGLTGQLSSKIISRCIHNALLAGYYVEEFLPDKIIERTKISDINLAINLIHFPKTKNEFYQGKQRIIFGELLVFTLANLYQRRINKLTKGYKILPSREMKNFISSLPFKLTGDQVSTLDDIMKDFISGQPASRLVQGDVGSGKTIVALAASVATMAAGKRAVWLAPTEILADQHYKTAQKLLSGFDYKCQLVTAATKRVQKQKDKKIFSPDGDLIIGTHAIFQDDVKISDVAVVIVDEQHRFGVEQRSKLSSGEITPHFISLSATPIPRSLAHIIFGNLDISVIKSKPIGRKPVKTYLVSEQKRNSFYEFVLNLIKRGQKAFIICPLIESAGSKDLFGFDEAKAIETEFENLKKTPLGSVRIGKLHGKMKSDKKIEVMRKMNEDEVDVLVCTSVVEVGVDVTSATVMIIEDAEKFGLSQLHQFRGRVGRNDLQSYCFIFTKNIKDEVTRERLKAFVRSSDGFELAQKDLELRGPGAILGTQQSGFSGFNPLWLENTKTLKDARECAQMVVGDVEKHKKLFVKLTKLLETDHLE
jgi:ATP-dependent DNA helicase RecG